MKPQTSMTIMCSIRGVFFTGLLAVCLANFGEGSANAQTQWSGNGHSYAVVNQVTNWQQAKVLAQGMEFMGVPGHWPRSHPRPRIRLSRQSSAAL